MKKLFIVVAAIVINQSIFAYTHKVYNHTLESITLKLDQKCYPDKTIQLAPAKQNGDSIESSETTVSTDLAGLVCTNGFEARGATGSAVAQLTGLCLVPFLTEKSKNLEVHIYYQDITRSNDGRFFGKGIKIETR